ncbi:GNAT family N-acetyltransferase [Streptomyces sp. S063]|uniref:GNAT family N-acetyltransferase n=1 Tax=Streptomyces sp. S063 TaxID=2005885 RepID=UPI003FCCC252
MKYVIRRITAEGWRELRAIRLESLLNSPYAFGVRPADAVALFDRTWRKQAERAAADDALFVAIDETGSWAGTAGVAPLDGIPDTAHVHAVCVAPAHRGPDGPARALRKRQSTSHASTPITPGSPWGYARIIAAPGPFTDASGSTASGKPSPTRWTPPSSCAFWAAPTSVSPEYHIEEADGAVRIHLTRRHRRRGRRLPGRAAGAGRRPAGRR